MCPRKSEFGIGQRTDDRGQTTEDRLRIADVKTLDHWNDFYDFYELNGSNGLNHQRRKGNELLGQENSETGTFVRF